MIDPADPFEGLDPEIFTPEARARREQAALLAVFEAPPLEQLLPPDPEGQAVLEVGLENLRRIPRDEWVRMCREAEAADPHFAARQARYAEMVARRDAAWGEDLEEGKQHLGGWD